MRVHTEYEIVQQKQVAALCLASNVLFAGNLVPSVLFIKAEGTITQDVLTAPERDALQKSLVALNMLQDCWAALAVSQDTPIEEFRVLLETLDPSLVILLDKTAARYVSLMLDCPNFSLDSSKYVNGRTFIALEGFEASLTNDSAKRREWARLKRIAKERTF